MQARKDEHQDLAGCEDPMFLASRHDSRREQSVDPKNCDVQQREGRGDESMDRLMVGSWFDDVALVI